MAADRLQTVLARAGLASRRTADGWIAEGRVQVNGEVAIPGTRVTAGVDEVTIDGQPVALSAAPSVHLAVHKPRGVLSSSRSAHGRPAVVDLVQPRPIGRLWPAGRLDVESEGLMLLTNDGAWAQRLLHPRYGLEREYAVQLDHPPSGEDLARLRRGVDLDDGPARLLSAAAGRRPRGVAPDATSGGPWLTVRVGEGRKREVRRLFLAAGYRVQRLVRTGFGPVALGSLAAGAWRPLTPAEVAGLGGTPAPEPVEPAQPRRGTSRAGRRYLQVAVDGTSGSGKSTIGRALAARIGAHFVDTGLLYRAVTLATLEAAVDPDDEPAVAELARSIRIRVTPADAVHGEAGERVTIGRRDVTSLLRDPRIERAVPTVSQHPQVRAAMLKVQRDAARARDTVMVGRDIGTVVLPNADLKVFLTASVETRARRRAVQMGRPDRLDTYQREISARDRTDSTRAVAPLKRAPGALVLDTGELDVGGCVDAIVAALAIHHP
jgi:23S rRNA pseudouridine2605 synthase